MTSLSHSCEDIQCITWTGRSLQIFIETAMLASTGQRMHGRLLFGTFDCFAKHARQDVRVRSYDERERKRGVKCERLRKCRSYRVFYPNRRLYAENQMNRQAAIRRHFSSVLSLQVCTRQVLMEYVGNLHQSATPCLLLSVLTWTTITLQITATRVE